MSKPTNPYEPDPGFKNIITNGDAPQWKVAVAEAEGMIEDIASYQEELGKKIGAGCGVLLVGAFACALLSSCAIWTVAINLHLVQHFLH